MAPKEALIKELQDFIQSMEEEGIVDYRLREVYSLKETGGSSQFFENLISIFCSDTELLIQDLTRAMEIPNLDYNDILEYSIKMKGRGSSIGACRFASACDDLLRASDNNSGERCYLAFERIKGEFIIVKEKFTVLLEIILTLAYTLVRNN